MQEQQQPHGWMNFPFKFLLPVKSDTRVAQPIEDIVGFDSFDLIWFDVIDAMACNDWFYGQIIGKLGHAASASG
jgi:hypothetical protein